MKELGKQTQQGYIRLRIVRQIQVSQADSFIIELISEDKTWYLTPDEVEKFDYWFNILTAALSPYIA